jgi:hypothetical protein
MKYKFRSGTGMLAMLLLSLCACRKENKTESPAPAPLPQLATSNYSDDFGTISNLFEFQYDAGDKRTKQVRNRWRTVNQTGDYSYRFNYTGQLGIRKEYDINNAEVPGSLRSYTFNDKGRAASCAFFDRFIQKNVLYQYEYNTAGFLNKTSVYYEGVLKYSREYYYNAASRLDSTAAFIHLANSRPKFSISVFEYETSGRNTIGDYQMFSAIATSYLDYAGIFGAAQPLALTKETVWSDGGQGLYKSEEHRFTNEFDGNGRLVKRTAVIKGYNNNGTLLVTINRVFGYTYQ